MVGKGKQGLEDVSENGRAESVQDSKNEGYIEDKVNWMIQNNNRKLSQTNKCQRMKSK